MLRVTRVYIQLEVMPLCIVFFTTKVFWSFLVHVHTLNQRSESNHIFQIYEIKNAQSLLPNYDACFYLMLYDISVAPRMTLMQIPPDMTYQNLKKKQQHKIRNMNFHIWPRTGFVCLAVEMNNVHLYLRWLRKMKLSWPVAKRDLIIYRIHV